nr:uncharacterized protein LOC109781861 isoform X2 [Aegilops tauschii subsp. strangulata]
MAMRSKPGVEPPPQDVNNPLSDRVEDPARHPLADATLTSRISIQKFCCVVSQFSNFKRGLVTGFGGLMHLKITHKLNLKFSSSLMVRVDPDECVLELDRSRKIPITDQEINDAFGLPQGSRIIPPGHSDLSEVCIEFSRLASSISTKGVHSLKAAEFILSKQLAGLTTCRLIDSNPSGQIVNHDRHRRASMLPDDLSDSEGSSTGHIHQARKRVYVESTDNILDNTHIGQNKKHQNDEQGSSFQDGNHIHLSLSPATSALGTNSSIDLISLVYYHDQLFSSLLMLYEDRSGVVFSQLTDMSPPTAHLPCK